MNIVALHGRLTRDPELRYSQTGTAISSFGLAVDRYKEGVDFFEVTCFGGVGESVANNLTKGRLVGVTGRLQLDQWEKDGQKRSKVSVVANAVDFLDWPEK